MGTDTRHLALVQHNDLLGVEDGGDPLGHNDDGSILHLLAQRPAQSGIGLVVQGGEGVGKQIYLRIFGNSSGDG